MKHFIPNRRARHKFMAEHLTERGIPSEYANLISLRLIPDVLVFHAVYVNPQSCHLEILDTGHVYINMNGRVFYCGAYQDKETAIRFANLEWFELEYVGLDNESRLKLDVEKLLSNYDETQHSLVHKFHRECAFKASIDITPILKEFVEGTDEVIH